MSLNHVQVLRGGASKRNNHDLALENPAVQESHVLLFPSCVEAWSLCIQEQINQKGFEKLKVNSAQGRYPRSPNLIIYLPSHYKGAFDGSGGPDFEPCGIGEEGLILGLT
jgi:hypothetical protein